MSPLGLTLLLPLVPAGEPEVKLVAGPAVRRLPQQISSEGFFQVLKVLSSEMDQAKSGLI